MTTETTKIHFKNWYRSLPNSEILRFRDEIIAATHCTKAIFHNWIKPTADSTPVPVLAQEKINEIAKQTLLFTNGVTAEPMTRKETVS